MFDAAAVMAELNDVRTLPDGLKMEASSDGYITVSGSAWAFCITPVAVRDGIHKTSYSHMLDLLLKAEEDTKGAQILRVASLSCTS